MLSAEDNQYLTQIGPGTPMGTFLRRYWIPALVSDELPEPDCPPVRVKLMGENLVAFRDSNNRIGLVDEQCPHRRASMFFGRNEECGLRCVYHGWKFDLDGQCVDMPSEPAESNFKDSVTIKSYPCKESGGVIWAYMGPPEHMPELPSLPVRFVGEKHRIVARHWWQCNYFQGIESAIDSSHISFLHRRTSVNPSPYEKVRNKFGNPKFEVVKTDYGLAIGAKRTTEDPDKVYWRITQHIMPWYQLIPPFSLETTPMSPTFTICFVPVDDENLMSWLFLTDPLHEKDSPEFSHKDQLPEMIPGLHLNTANKNNDYLVDRKLQASRLAFSGIPNVQAEDMAMSEAQGAISDRAKERLGTSDAAIIVARQLFLQAAKAFHRGEQAPLGLDPEKAKVRAVSTILNEGVDFTEGAEKLLAVKEY